MKAARPL